VCRRRQHEHFGKSPIRLIQALTGCSHEQARAWAGVTDNIPKDAQDFMSRVNAALIPPTWEQSKPLKMPPQFKRITFDAPTCRPFIKYLERRCFSYDDISQLSSAYGLRYCSSGPFKWRIIFPVVRDKRLVTWTGRTIDGRIEPRYKTLSVEPNRAADDGLAPAAMPITDCLLWHDRLLETDAHTIFLCEGPFDALKMRVLGRELGVCATCFFTAQPSHEQVNILHEVLPRFKNRFLLLDQGTLPTALRIAGELSSLGVSIATLPKGVKDPGALQTTSDLQKIIVA